MYIEGFELPSTSFEEIFLNNQKHTCYSSFYPFMVFPQKQLSELSFAPVTFLYGGNGSGKSTLLNVIAARIGLSRDTSFNKSNFFDEYVEKCDFWTPRYASGIPEESRMITSDDVFDYVLNIRSINEGVDLKRDELFTDYLEEKYSSFQMKSLQDYERLKKHRDSVRLTQSEYIRRNVMGNLQEKSNGESAFAYFTEHIKQNALYLLDEPENSLAAGLQLQLKSFIEDSVRFFRCQFIIATHSPFLLAMENAQIYDLDSVPVKEKRWTELGNIRAYYDFFMEHGKEFHKD